MKQITDKTELIIGIDFGHGETSAALYGLKDNKQADIDIFPGRKAIKSAVAILDKKVKKRFVSARMRLIDHRLQRISKFHSKNAPQK